MQTDRVQPGGVWYTSVAPGAHRLVRGRHVQRLTITDDEVVVLGRDATLRTHGFEFRPRRQAAGRAFADSLR